MKFEKHDYKGYVITQRIDEKSHCASIYLNDNLVKMVAGGIFSDGSNDAIEKAKNYIDTL